MKARTVVALLATLTNAACIDFVEPVFPPTGPAAFSAEVHLLTGGVASVRAHLVPGINTQHLWRPVVPDTLRINNVSISSSRIQADNQRDYNADVTVDAGNTGVVRIQPPGVAGLTPPVVVQLPIVQRADPDTVRFLVLAPFELHVRVPPGMAIDSANVSRSWLVEITDGKKTFRVGADGAPPGTIIIPREFQPLDRVGISTATLFVFESRRVDQPSGDYIAAYSLDTRVRWTILTFVN
jgi:hypothetical protein